MNGLPMSPSFVTRFLPPSLPYPFPNVYVASLPSYLLPSLFPIEQFLPPSLPSLTLPSFPTYLPPFLPTYLNLSLPSSLISLEKHHPLPCPSFISKHSREGRGGNFSLP